MTQVCACVLWCIIKIVRDNTGFPPILGLPQAKLAAFPGQKPENSLLAVLQSEFCDCEEKISLELNNKQINKKTLTFVMAFFWFDYAITSSEHALEKYENETYFCPPSLPHSLCSAGWVVVETQGSMRLTLFLHHENP